MRFILAILCFIFSGIFYFFSSFFSENTIKSFSWNLTFETLFFLILGIFFFFYFGTWKKTLYDNEEKQKKSYINWNSIWKITKKFFKKYLYYFGFLFFYTAIYFIFFSFEWGTFSYFIFALNIIVLSLFFITNRLFILKDFLKVNTVVFSFIYIIFFIYIFLTKNNFFITIDFINSLWIILLFIIFLWSKNFQKKHKENDPMLISYFSFYSLIFGTFYIDYILKSPLLSISIFSFFLGIILFYLPQISKFFLWSKKYLRTIGILFLYISSFYSIIYIFQEWVQSFLLFSLIIGIFFHMRVHFLYQNYISLIFGFLNFFFLFSYFFFTYFYIWEQKDMLFLINYMILAFSFIFYTYINTAKYLYDTYFIHIFSYIVNVFWVVGFFVFSEIHIFNLWIIMLLESIFVFLSYYKLYFLK